MAFESIVGNEQIKEILRETISTRRFLHSYLFIGESGIGKKLFAKEFARYILCDNQEDIFYYQENLNNHPDFYIITPDGSSIKIEQIRMLQTKIIEKPIRSNKKVYIIEDCNSMTKEAQNCLLKTLEEPPEYTVIILLCSNENALLSTIQSRCTKLVFKKISKEDLRQYIKKENLFQYVDDNLLEAMNGSIGKAYEIKEKQELYEEVREYFRTTR